MERTIMATAATLGGTAVILGAFAAHLLKSKLQVNALDVFETGVRYQMYHALVLLFVGQTKCIATAHKKTVFALLLTGVLLFSGSLYCIATSTITGFTTRILGPITPLGGIFLILGWSMLFIRIIATKKE